MNPVNSPKIKVCGITDIDNAREVARLGVDALGMILYANSPRTISIETGARIREVVPEHIRLVGVFVNARSEFIESATHQCGLDVVQLHGDESNQFGANLNRPFVKAIRVKDAEQLKNNLDAYPDACALLLDPYVKNMAGGTGKQLDLSLWPHGFAKPLVLAGGLSPQNIKAAVNLTSPNFVDLNSGVETSPGIKDPSKIEACLSALSEID